MGKLLGGGPVCESQCNDVRCCTSTQRVVDPRWPHPERPRQISEGSETSVQTFWRRKRKQRQMATIYCDSRKRVAGDDASLPLHGPRPVPLLGRLSPRELELGDLACRRLHRDSAGGLDLLQLAETNEIQIAYDGNRRVLNDSELRDQFPGTGSYPPGASASKPLSINHLLGPSFIDGALQIHNFVVMNPYSELYLRCSTLANAAEIKGPLGSDIICKLSS